MRLDVVHRAAVRHERVLLAAQQHPARECAVHPRQKESAPVRGQVTVILSTAGRSATSVTGGSGQSIGTTAPAALMTAAQNAVSSLRTAAVASSAGLICAVTVSRTPS